MTIRSAILVCLCASRLCAQSPLGIVTGVVNDPSQSPVPHASLTLENLDTNVKHATASNTQGVYAFPNLPPGRYKLAGTAAGFREFETSEPLIVLAFRTVRQDLRLELASASTAITVSEAVSPVIQTESPAINARLSTKQILELPTNLRSIYNNSGDSGLIFIMMPLLTPGMVQVNNGAAWLVPGSGANGVRAKVDGIETTFGNFGSPDSVSQPSFESVEEFTANILTNRAEFGGLGTITTVTRSGANGYHGGLFWYLRNSGLDARNAFATAKPFQNIHNYGGTFGGPVRRDRTFFFATIDGTRGVRGYLFTSNVPTLAMRQGDFSSAAALKNPYAGFTPFDSSNRILPQYLSPQAIAIQNQYFPLPNYGPPSLTAGNYRASFNGGEVHWIGEGRLDHNFSNGHSAFLRYQNKRDDYQIPGARSTLPPQATGTSTNLRTVSFVTLGDAITLRANLFNEARAGLLLLSSSSDSNLRGQALLDQFGISGLGPRQGIKGIPNLGISGLSTATQSLLNPVDDGHWQISDNLTWTTGRHTLKFGAETIYWMVDRYLTTDSGLFGNFSFNPTFTGNAYADFLLGLPSSVARIEPYPTQRNRFRDWNLYAQDDFKITGRLTLSYGLRYEYNGPVRALEGNLYSFDLASGSVIIPSDAARKEFSPFFPSTVPIVTASQLGLGEGLRHADNNNFGPRFGFSYQLGSSARTVLRGGWGIYYAHLSGAVAAALAAGPYSLSTTTTNSFTNGSPLITLANPFQAPNTSGTLNFTAISPNLRNSYTMQYSFTVERELTRDIGLRLSYIGSRGVQLVYERNVNQPFPSTTKFTSAARPFPRYNSITYADNGANSLYSGLQVQAQKRFSHGLLFSSAWTWAKSLSEVDDTGNAELNTLIENAYDRRRDRADVVAVPRHQWTNQVLYELPWLRGAHGAAHGFAGHLLGGWQTNFLINASTGNFFNPQFSGSDPSNTNNTSGRPDVLGPVAYPETIAAWYDRTAFAVPPANSGRFGDAARNSVVGPGYVIANFGMGKTFRLERAELQVGATFQNLLNHVNLGSPNMTVNNANGGTITATHIFPPAGSARTGQLSLRLAF